MRKKTDFSSPFDADKEPEKNRFFVDISNAINDWMLTQYPDFDNRLAGKINEIEQKTDLALKKLIDIVEQSEKKEKDFIQNAKKEINSFMDEKFPGIASRLSIATLDAEELVKKLKLKNEQIEKIVSKLGKSHNLYQDVYKVRDEISELNKAFAKIKELFK